MELAGNIVKMLSLLLAGTCLVMVLARVLLDINIISFFPWFIKRFIYSAEYLDSNAEHFPAGAHPKQGKPASKLGKTASKSGTASAVFAKIHRILDCIFIKDAPSWANFLRVLIVATSSRLIIFGMVNLIKAVITSSFSGYFINFFSEWCKQDAVNYISIAKNGYVTTGNDRVFLVFYPLYPLLVRISKYIFQNYYVSGFIVSNICLAIACYYLYKLVMLEYGSKKLSISSVKYLLIFPFSFFTGTVFTESLFLALSAIVLYYTRKKKWAIAGIAGMLAALTRNQGMLLVVPIIIEIVLDSNFMLNIKERKLRKLFTHLLKSAPYTLFIPAGFGIYLLINKLVSGDWFKFLYYQRTHWYNTMGLFADTVKLSFIYSINYEFLYRIGTFIPQFIFFFFTLTLIIISVRKVRVSYTAYSLIYLIFSYSPTWLLSGARYIAGILPVYIFLALAAPRHKVLRYAADALMFILLLLFSTTFIMWGTY